MLSKVPNVVLNNGIHMPILGLGTWGVRILLFVFFVKYKLGKQPMDPSMGLLAINKIFVDGRSSKKKV